MAKKTKLTEYYCLECGEILTDENCRPSNRTESGLQPICVGCEQKHFDELADLQGRYHALYSSCVTFDVPIVPMALDGVDFNSVEDAWITYLNILSERGLDRKRGKQLGFSDGVTTLWGLFGNKLGESDLELRIKKEKEQLARKPKLEGTEEQRDKWGTEPLYSNGKSSIRMTQEVYDELDRQYSNRAESYKGQTLTPQMEDILVKVAKSNVIYDHLMRTGVVKLALDVQKSIDLMLASEQMRKKDEKPIANFAPDAWVDALEKSGLMQDGQFLSLPEIEDAMIKIMRGKGYDQTLDCAHQLEINIINNAKRNADQPVIFELPQDMKITDELVEFAPEESEEEQEAKNYAHLTKVRFESSKGE